MITRRRVGPSRATLIERATANRAARSRARGIVLYGLGGLFVIALFVFELAAVATKSGSNAAARLGLVVPLAVLLTGPIMRRGRQLRAKPAEDVLTATEHPPIIYLRPFSLDGMPVLPVWRSRRRWRPLRWASAFGVPSSYEEVLARALTGLPFVTIGEPTERLPEPGAARDYAADDVWQEHVSERLALGGPIILHAGNSQGVQWEIEHVVGLNQPERVILSLPLNPPRASFRRLGKRQRHQGPRTRRERQYAEFRRGLGALFPQELPAGAAATQFIYFTPDWTPHRVEEEFNVPAVDGSITEVQRDVVLRKLAAEFKLMWAPLCVRAFVYAIITLALLEGLYYLGGADNVAVWLAGCVALFVFLHVTWTVCNPWK